MIYKSLNEIVILQYTCNSEMYSKTSILKEKKNQKYYSKIRILQDILRFTNL